MTLIIHTKGQQMTLIIPTKGQQMTLIIPTKGQQMTLIIHTPLFVLFPERSIGTDVTGRGSICDGERQSRCSL
jgi:hypothetical protein